MCNVIIFDNTARAYLINKKIGNKKILVRKMKKRKKN